MIANFIFDLLIYIFDLAKILNNINLHFKKELSLSIKCISDISKFANMVNKNFYTIYKILYCLVYVNTIKIKM